MGYLPKHIKVRRQRECRRQVAMAALVGWRTHKFLQTRVSDGETFVTYELLSPRGHINGYYCSRARAARVSLREEGITWQ